MKKYLNIVLVFCAVAILGTGCKKNIDDFTPKTPTVLGKLIQHDLSGQVIDENHEPVADAEVHYGTGMTKTDENGIFIIRDAQVNDDHAYVTVDKSGFFQGSRLFVAKEGKTAYTTIQLLTKNLAGSFDASTGSAVSFEGVQLDFPQNAIVDESGNNYNGSVSVYANYIDPESDDFLIQMPADLRAFSATNQEVVLESYGMMAVELEGSNGEKLQVKEGEKVSFEMPVPQSILASAPSTIPLWHLDEVTGFWQEEGSASLEGNMYKGTVGHFSFWNCDAPFPLVYVEGSVVDLDGNPVTNVYVQVETTDGLARSGGVLDTDGTFGGKMPKDKELKFTLRVRGGCYAVVFEETVGPFSTDVTLPPFVIDPSTVPNIVTVNITGRIVDCNGNVAPNSYVRVGKNNSNYFFQTVESDGTFDFTFSLCDINQTFDVNAFNADTRKVSLTQVALVAGTIDLGDIRDL
ncbi:MAG: carboxypeptidase-like regulatory domain-containing protein [Saprospiraceae bacterium]